MNQSPKADVETRHYRLTCFGPGRWVLLRSSKDAGCHFVPPHGLFLGLIKAQGEVGATTGRTQHSVERGSFTACASASCTPAHHFNHPGKLLPEFQPGTVSPLLFSGTYKNKMLSCSTCALVPSTIMPRAAPTTLSQIKNKNNYVGTSNSSFFKSTLGRFIFNHQTGCTAQTEAWTKGLVAPLMLGAAAFI